MPLDKQDDTTSGTVAHRDIPCVLDNWDKEPMKSRTNGTYMYVMDQKHVGPMRIKDNQHGRSIGHRTHGL